MSKSDLLLFYGENIRKQTIFIPLFARKSTTVLNLQQILSRSHWNHFLSAFREIHSPIDGNGIELQEIESIFDVKFKRN